MFLISQVYLCSNGNIINSILSWIESHSVFIGVITAMIVSSLWFRSFLRQKRAEAFFGFYARLILQLKSLSVWLEEKDMLSVDEIDQNGNIYAIMYDFNTLSSECPGFHDLEQKEIDELKEITSQIKKTLLESENNVYPKGSSREVWYESQYILLSFCEFIERDSLHRSTNKPKYTSGNHTGMYKHIVKCTQLITAIDAIQSSIQNENY